MIRWPALLVLATLCATAGGVELKCGKKPAKGATKVTIALHGPRSDEGATPVYYFSNSSYGYVIFFRPADVLTTIDDMLAAGKAGNGQLENQASRNLMENFAAEVRKDLPLADHTDLRKYALRNSMHGIMAQYLVADLLKQGRASVGGWSYFSSAPGANAGTVESIDMYAVPFSNQDYNRQFCSREGAPIFGLAYFIDD